MRPRASPRRPSRRRYAWAGSIAGRVQVMFESLNSIAPHAQSGSVRPLGVSGARRSPAFPDLPTIAAAGVSGFEAETIFGMWAPARTPGAVISRLNQEIVRAPTQPDIRDKLATVGVSVVANTPKEFMANVQEELRMWINIVKATGITAD